MTAPRHLRILPVVGVAALVACGSKSHGGGGGNSGCPAEGAGNIQITAQGEPVSNTCYESFQPAPNVPIRWTGGATSGVQLVFGSNASDSSYGSEADGVGIVFSSACSFTAGQTLPLSSPCLGIGVSQDGSVGSLPLQPFLGYANTCVPDFAVNDVNFAPGCAFAAAPLSGAIPDTSLTTGTITLTQWSVTPGHTVSVSVSGTLTGFVLQGNATSGFTTGYVTVPISGTATAIIGPQGI